MPSGSPPGSHPPGPPPAADRSKVRSGETDPDPVAASASRRDWPDSTRQRLVAAAIDLVRQEGLAALTTVRVARAAGIAQPGFYKHFKNMDDCLLEAAAQVVGRMHQAFAEMRRSIPNRNDPHQLSGHYAAVLLAMREDRPFAELLLRYRRHPSPLGHALRQTMDQVRADFAADLWREGVRVGLKREHFPRLKLLADLILANLMACVEHVLDEPAADIPTLADELAHYTIAGTMDTYSRLLGRPVGKRR